MRLGRETHVDHDPVAGLRILDETDVDVLLNAAEVSDGLIGAQNLFEFSRNCQAHINGP